MPFIQGGQQQIAPQLQQIRAPNQRMQPRPVAAPMKRPQRRPMRRA